MQRPTPTRSPNPIKRLARAGIGLGLANAHLRAVVASELRRLDASRATRPAAGGVPGGPAEAPRIFVDRHGGRHELDPRLRDRLKPGWRVMVDPEAIVRPPTDEVLQGRMRNATRVVAEARSLVASVTGAPLAGRILEIGCFDGSAAYQLAHTTGGDIVATDMARYYVVQRPGRPQDGDVAVQQGWLAAVRGRACTVAGAPDGSVTFLEDDITQSGLEPASFDAIVSFEVLEHVQDPGAALAAMARLLRPGGVMYHDYNPFFSAIGGHSLCTLDFPWGHARLDDADFERYVRELRPTETDQALRFFRESLNRMTVHELRAHVAAAGLELLALVPWHDRAQVASLGAEVLDDVRREYPAATPNDLLATFVALVARRPIA